MEFKKVKKTVEVRNITNVKYPFSSPEIVLKRRKEKPCYFCGKKYGKCEFLGITMSDKGSKICCDDCAVKFKRGLKNEA